MIVIGVDVHKQSLTAVAVDEAGRMLDQQTVSTAEGAPLVWAAALDAEDRLEARGEGVALPGVIVCKCLTVRRFFRFGPGRRVLSAIITLEVGWASPYICGTTAPFSPS